MSLPIPDSCDSWRHAGYSWFGRKSAEPFVRRPEIHPDSNNLGVKARERVFETNQRNWGFTMEMLAQFSDKRLQEEYSFGWQCRSPCSIGESPWIIYKFLIVKSRIHVIVGPKKGRHPDHRSRCHTAQRCWLPRQLPATAVFVCGVLENLAKSSMFLGFLWGAYHYAHFFQHMLFLLKERVIAK
jgi:hypothetical protein